jgi:DNA-binding NarL/FixJ family response regulator
MVTHEIAQGGAVQPAESILLVDDHALLRESLAAAFRNAGMFSEVFEAQDGEEALRVAEVLQPTLILMDVALPDGTGFEVMPRLKSVAPGALVVFLSMHRLEVYAAKAFALGAAGYLSKSLAFDEVTRALGEVLEGKRVLDPNMSPPAVEALGLQASTSRLEDWPLRQLEVFYCLLAGQSTADTALHLGVSEKTVESYRSKIFKALGVTSTPELLVKARAEGLDLLIPRDARRDLSGSV